MKKELKILQKEFQKITGRPFIPSPKDMVLLLKWFEKGVPINAIIEGIRMGWEKRKRKKASISSFKKDIERAILSYRENIIGGEKEPINKEILMLEEIKNFIRNIPVELEFTKGIFEEAIKILKSKKRENVKMAILEKLEGELEKLLLERFSKEGEPPEKIIKTLRLNYRIPRLLRYYY